MELLLIVYQQWFKGTIAVDIQDSTMVLCRAAADT
jgi:hypothetical protein